MGDKFTRGLMAGIVSGIVTNILDILMGSMGMTTLRFVDWTGIIVLAHIPPYTLGETIFSFISQIFFSASLGVTFAYLIPQINNKNLFLKSWFFSLGVWFAVDGITTLYKIEGTIPIPLGTGISNVISATIFGLALAQCLKIFEYADVTSSLKMQPAMKPIDPKDGDDKRH